MKNTIKTHKMAVHRVARGKRRRRHHTESDWLPIVAWCWRLVWDSQYFWQLGLQRQLNTAVYRTETSSTDNEWHKSRCPMVHYPRPLTHLEYMTTTFSQYRWQISTIRYDTRLRDALLTCARKPTRVSLIYRTESTTKKFKNRKSKK